MTHVPVDLLLVNVVVGVVLPLLVQLVTKAHASAAVKSLASLLLSGVASVLTPLMTADHIDWRATVLSLAQIFALTVATHVGLFKPLNVTGADGAIATAVPGGVGPDPAPAAPAASTPPPSP